MGVTEPESVSIAAGRAREGELLDAATSLFAERGYGDADTQALVERMGVGKGTLYRYFASKKALFLAAVDRVMRRMTAQIDASVAGVEDPLERIAVAIRAYLEFFATNPEYVELLIQERALFRDREKPTYFAYRERNMVRWRELYRSLIYDGRIRDMPVEEITEVLGHLVYGTMFTNYFTGQPKSSPEQAREILDVVFYGILSERERRRLVVQTPESKDS
ncbi:MAG: transcriptional regulator [Planctomycetota bacterium]|nr:transcriptional regulator [Planctomycetota bacterium]